MFLITAQFRPSRSKRDTEKEGVVFYRIIGQAAENGRRPERNVNSDIRATDSSVLETERATILLQLRLLYCIIERREESKEPFNIDDIADDFRKALSENASSMREVIDKSQVDFPLRNDIVSVGREFKGDFKFVFPKQTDISIENIFGYIFNLSQSLKNEGRISQSRNIISLLANLKLFAEGKSILFHEINKEFINRYADWLKHLNISDSTESFYLRNFRSVLNKAHDDGLIGSTSGWFQDVNTRIGHSTKTPDGKLSRDMMLKIENLDLSDNNNYALVRDMFMFGFYCGGMELIDIANLEYSNVKNGVLIYRRRLKGHERKVILGEQAIKIIERYKGMSNKYLFPLLSKSEYALFASVRNYACQSLKAIGRAVNYPKLCFNMNITAYHYILSEVNIPELLLKRE